MLKRRLDVDDNTTLKRLKSATATATTADICSGYTKKRPLDSCKSDTAQKKARHEQKIDLLINEINPMPKRRFSTFIHPTIDMQYCDGVDFRRFYATDIQRVFKGWIQRKRLAFMNLHNEFIYSGDL